MDFSLLRTRFIAHYLSISDSKSTTGERKIRKTYSVHLKLNTPVVFRLCHLISRSEEIVLQWNCREWILWIVIGSERCIRSGQAHPCIHTNPGSSKNLLFHLTVVFETEFLAKKRRYLAKRAPDLVCTVYRYTLNQGTRSIDLNWFCFTILREGPRLQGGYSGGSGSGVPPYDFLKLYGVFGCRFSPSFS